MDPFRHLVDSLGGGSVQRQGLYLDFHSDEICVLFIGDNVGNILEVKYASPVSDNLMQNVITRENQKD
jgi:hypothetical protein